MTAVEILKKYWGFDSFRKQQEEIVQSAINGHDTFALLPTGGGKSICFQVPGIAREGICLVISPLIALMQDQVKNLRSRGLKAAAITSGMSRREIDIILDNAKFGGLDFLYVSPERLKTDIFIARFKQMKISLIAIDEAHCISQWGHDFRPPYLEIYKLREIHSDVPIIAVTATATKEVRQDIIEHLEMKNPNYFEGDFTRDNISYEVYAVENKRNAILKACKRFSGNTGIVYCQTRRETKEIARLLIAHNFSAGVYHGGMNGEERDKKLNAWLNNEIRIVVATNAFGMGIDKPDVRFVLHYEIPNNLEAYFQEAGRSGRDGKASRNMAFYTQVDLVKMRQRIEKQFPPIDFIKTVYRALCNHFGIAIGSGANESYGLSIRDLVKKYDFDPVQTYNALKILELNGSILFNEAVFHPTKLKFIVSNKTLYNFQLKNKDYDPIISYLSRSHPGIFENYFQVDEARLSTKLKKSRSLIHKQLQYIEKQGLADISWQSELPQVTLLHERLPDDYMQIDKKVYQIRKDVANKKLESLIGFIQQPICRSILLLKYFGQEGKACGKCDVCLAEERSNYSGEELQEIIQQLLRTKSYSMEELIFELKGVEKHYLNGILNWMMDENLVHYEAGVFSQVD
ncbi:RecQ family ATP-dependent DNA helicase [Brumimicrobium aurantiacum]|uniref:ATP-dependent DNA helicase RecQ n=1 Tax=Brumimicrobium aurantiacum TaxID=1737063 RepID=A0A3E1EWD7_9FLAO|nr:ATP-dependent DNA helicase RecQ [Brumimicrobium aurantiacum]RFC53874.1 RecQ family ATP-dependent DNA helicase [Brumimicrobium aurantiacum]